MLAARTLFKRGDTRVHVDGSVGKQLTLDLRVVSSSPKLGSMLVEPKIKMVNTIALLLRGVVHKPVQCCGLHFNGPPTPYRNLGNSCAHSSLGSPGSSLILQPGGGPTSGVISEEGSVGDGPLLQIPELGGPDGGTCA